MNDPLEESLLDAVALEEIDLMSRLTIAASGCVEHLSQREVDDILGIAASG